MNGLQRLAVFFRKIAKSLTDFVESLSFFSRMPIAKFRSTPAIERSCERKRTRRQA